MNPVLSQIKVTPMGEFETVIFGHPASSVFFPRAVFNEYHLKAFNCTIIGDFLEITRFVVQDKGCGHGGRLLDDLDEWAKDRGLRLCLTPLPYGENSEMASRRLINFYKRKGFVLKPDDMWCPEVMYRP